MFHGVDDPTRTRGPRETLRYLPPELAIDLEADNALLRAALATSEGVGVRRDLIAKELQHRMGNLLAVVTAIARQTFATADAASVDAFCARMLALAAAQKLLIDAQTQAASVRDVVTDSLEPHSSADDRVKLSGPEVALDGRRAHALMLALHELATNATKYGALSSETGGVEISWTEAGGQFELLWREHDGPLVVAPTRRGFGTKLVNRNLGVAFSGQVELAFDPTGFTCQLRAPSMPASALPVNGETL